MTAQVTLCHAPTVSPEPPTPGAPALPPPTHAVAERARIALRRSQAIDLRSAGVDLVTVGRQLRYGKWDPDGNLLTSERSLAGIVAKDVARGLEDRRAHLHASADEHIRLATERAERLRAAAWTQAVKGSVAHIRECRQLDEHLARLHGWNKPVKHEVTAPEATSMVEQAVADLIRLLDKPSEGAPAFGKPRVIGET